MMSGSRIAGEGRPAATPSTSRIRWAAACRSKRRGGTLERDATTAVRPVRGPARPDPRRGDAHPRRDRHGDPRARDASAAARGRPADERGRRPGPVPPRIRRARRARPPRPRSSCTTGTATSSPTSAGTASTSCPARAACACSTTAPARPACRHHRLRRVRPSRRRPRAHRLSRDGLLDQQGHRGAGFGRVAPLPDPDQHEEAGRVGRLHRAWRAADGRDDGAVP